MIWGLIPGPIRRGLVWLGLGLAAIWAAWVIGKREGRADAVVADLKDYKETRKAMDDARIDFHGDDALARGWLRKRAKR